MTKPVRSVLLFGCAMWLSVGCAEKTPNCQNAIDTLIRVEFSGYGRNQSVDEKKMIDEMMPGTRTKLVDWCQRRKFSEADLRCVIAARRHADWTGCGEFNQGYGPPLPDAPPSIR